MKEFLIDTLEQNPFLENDLKWTEDYLVENALQNSSYKKEKKSFFFERKIRKVKRPSEFSSMERIKIVVDGLIGNINEKEICYNQGISLKVYLEWKNDFLVAFKKYSEIELLRKALSSKNKDLIINELGLEVYNFYEKFVNVSSTKNLVVPKDKILSSYSNFNQIKNLILLNKINNFRQINKQLEEVNEKLPNGGIVMGNFETFNSKIRKTFFSRIPVIKHFYAGFNFFFNRVCPKLPYIKKAYFYLTKGKNRLLSKAEALGRLVSCGFEIIDFEEINGIYYFAVKKIKKPAYNMNPSYGPLFKMQRIGKNGKMVGIYKLRTMHPYSEYLQEYMYKNNGSSNGDKINEDFRVASWGKISRKLWLDELPMLFNLLRGDIKLVGVRPLSLAKYNLYNKNLQKLRIKTKPGLLPPFYADMPNSLEEIMESETKYLEQYLKSPILTDFKYFRKICFNILFKGFRSA